ncbi:hypothetical protein DP73_15700 [Desulfosporosinus sp. HMP52]|nr:hypothetical protein DP73_15700 [Desulfosporosinus sp. HMP52]
MQKHELRKQSIRRKSIGTRNGFSTLSRVTAKRYANRTMPVWNQVEKELAFVALLIIESKEVA